MEENTLNTQVEQIRSKGLRTAGVVIGTVGLGMALSTAPIYKKILNKRKNEYAPKIIELSEKILNG